MTSSDVLNVILSIGFIVIVACLGLITYYLILTLKAIKKLAENLENTADGVSFLKDRLKMGALGIISAFVTSFLQGFIKKRG